MKHIHAEMEVAPLFRESRGWRAEGQEQAGIAGVLVTSRKAYLSHCLAQS